MSELVLSGTPRTQTGIVIHRPALDVYTAFVDPAVTTRFWFTDSTGPLEPGAEVTWTWSMHSPNHTASATVRVKELRPRERIHVEWGDPEHGFVDAVWHFDRRSDGITSVRVEEYGYTGDGDAILARVLDSTIGFTKMLVAAKALLEHDIVVDVVSDR